MLKKEVVINKEPNNTINTEKLLLMSLSPTTINAYAKDVINRAQILERESKKR
ncbi:MAG: hypothetical protein RSF40_10945 [Oscillospiraceae bacterium]